MTALIPDEIAAHIVHGSVQGFELGCRSKGGCANHGHRTLMTCHAAKIAASADAAIAKLPRNQALRKSLRRLKRPTPAPARSSAAAAATNEEISMRVAHSAQAAVDVQQHGTRHRFASGCKTDQGCPNHGTDRPTCGQAQRDYFREWRANRKKAAKPAQLGNQPLPFRSSASTPPRPPLMQHAS